MKQLIHFVSNYLLGDLSPLPKPGFFSLRFIANVGALFFLVFGYILGCRALYHYLEPQWGEVFSLLALCVLLIATSLFLLIIGWLLKPKEPPLKDFVLNIEKALSEIPNNEMVKTITSKLTPKTIATIFAIVAVTSYLARGHKKT